MSTRKWQYVGLAVLAVITLIAVVGALNQPTPAPVAVPQSSVGATVETREPSAPTVSDAVKELENQDQPWVMTVIGDSTGNAPDEWVYLTTTELASTYDRPAIIHNWDAATNSYTTETTIGSGDAEPIIVWNGSASGMDGGYSIDNFEALTPMPSDLVILNHGHNATSANAAVKHISKLHNLVTWGQDDQPAVAVTLQNPRLDGAVEKHQEVVEALRDWAEAQPVAIIDVYSEFESAPALAPLVLDDGLHPSTSGSRIWADAVLDVLS